MKLYAPFLAVFLSASVIAGGNHHEPSKGTNGGNTSTQTVTASSVAVSAPKATGGAAEATASTAPINVTVNNNVSAKGGKGGKGGKAGSGNGDGTAGGGGTPGMPPTTPGTGGTGTPSGLYGSVVEWKVDNGGKINNVPALSNTYVSTSNTCDGYTGLTAAIAGGGFGLNFASQRTFCELRLAGMAYQAMNETTKAVRMIDLSVQLLCKADSNLAKLAVEECKVVQEKAPDEPNRAFQSAG